MVNGKFYVADLKVETWRSNTAKNKTKQSDKEGRKGTRTVATFPENHMIKTARSDRALREMSPYKRGHVVHA